MIEENNFKQIEPSQKLPRDMRDQVLNKLDTAKLFLDFWDLFATKRIQVNQEFLDNVNTGKNDLNP